MDGNDYDGLPAYFDKSNVKEVATLLLEKGFKEITYYIPGRADVGRYKWVRINEYRITDDFLYFTIMSTFEGKLSHKALDRKRYLSYLAAWGEHLLIKNGLRDK